MSLSLGSKPPLAAITSWLALVSSLVFSPAIHPAVINVGVGLGCEAATLEDAVGLADNTSAADEIRLLEGTTYETAMSVHLTDWNPSSKGTLTISGGFQDCTDTTGDGLPSTINNLGAGPVVEVDTTGGHTSTVTLINLRLSLSDGIGLLVQGNSTVVLQNSDVIQNLGGGIAVESGAFVDLDRDSSVGGNGPNSRGGGIYCTDAGSLVESAAFVSNNEATLGGGIAVESGCELLLKPGAVFSSNDAVFGGGFDADSGSLVSALGGNVFFSHNEATSSGGAISINGAGTQAFLAGIYLEANRAGFWGAGIYANGSAFIALGAHGSPCPLYYDCTGCQGFPSCPSLIKSSRLLGSAENGVAAIAANGAEVRLTQTVVFRSEIPETASEGSVFYATADNALIRTESVEVSDSTGVRTVFHGSDGGDLRIAMTTATDNFEDGTDLAEGVRVEGVDSNAWVNSSILYPVAGFVANGGGSFSEVNCLITSTTAGLPGSATFVSTSDPLFQDAENGDYHLLRDSPAVDYCDDSLFSPTVPGLDGYARGIDDPFNPNGSPGVGGPFSIQDLGAFEQGLIFADGFELGTSRWSMTVGEM